MNSLGEIDVVCMYVCMYVWFSLIYIYSLHILISFVEIYI